MEWLIGVFFISIPILLIIICSRLLNISNYLKFIINKYSHNDLRDIFKKVEYKIDNIEDHLHIMSTPERERQKILNDMDYPY
jgi:hypothetical protein